MAWCPKCKIEYSDGLRRCNKCNGKLITGKTGKERGVSKEYDYPAFLATAKNEIEFSMIKAKLKNAGIPVLKKHREAGDYLSIVMGISPFGVDAYVPSRLLDQAKELIKTEEAIDEEIIDEEAAYEEIIDEEADDEEIIF